VARPRFIASSLMRREAWEQVGGFPEDLRSAEDLVFMNRLEAAGYRAAFEPRARVHWNLRPSLEATFQRFLVYSRNNIRAGLWRQWQATILFRYAVLLALLVLALIIEPVLGWLVLYAWWLMMFARTVVSIRRNRDCYPASLTRNLGRGWIIMTLLTVLDTAAIIGTVQWLLLAQL